MICRVSPVVVYQDEDLETAAAGVVLVAQDGQLVAAHRHADRLRGDPVAALRGPVAHVVAQINLRRAASGGGQALRHHGRLPALPATVEGQRRRLVIAPSALKTARDIRYLPLAEGIRLGFHPLGSQDRLPPFKRLMPHEKRSLSKAYTSVSLVK